MAWTHLAWAAGGYVAGTFPSTWIVARAKRATGLLSAAGRSSGETDPHILMARHLGVGWSALAATLDVVKGFVYVLASRELGREMVRPSCQSNLRQRLASPAFPVLLIGLGVEHRQLDIFQGRGAR